MFLGIDLGTSSVKAVLIDDAGALVGEASAPLTVSRPQPLWSEQDPDDWWTATRGRGRALDRRHARARVRGVGLSGQMHGAVLLDARGAVHATGDPVERRPLGARRARELERREPRSRAITGNLAMPGFTAPKLVWVAAHEPERSRASRTCCCRRTGCGCDSPASWSSEPSDAAGTLWLDVARAALVARDARGVRPRGAADAAARAKAPRCPVA